MDYPYRKRRSSEDNNEDCPRASKPEAMSTWLQRQTSSHQVQLAGTALLSGLAVATTIFGMQAIRRRIAVDELKASIPNVDEHVAETVWTTLPLLVLATYTDHLSEAP